MQQDSSLGSHFLKPSTFQNKEAFFAKVSNTSSEEKEEKIFASLLELIQKAKDASFLLNAVLDFLNEAFQKELTNRLLHFSDFEKWLNESSGLSFEENLFIRGKIVGKYLPRSAYQVFFPIGNGKVFEGNHYVSAHLSPDIDTLTASFWGWVDAFAARLCQGVHIWHLPEGAPETPFCEVFTKLIGDRVLLDLPYIAAELPVLENGQKATLSMRDFSNFDEVKCAPSYELISVIDHHKSRFHTPVPSTVLTADVQSCNILTAEEAFKLSDSFGTGGMSLQQIDHAIKEGMAKSESQTGCRLLQKLYQRKANALSKEAYFISPEREFSEYLTFLYAIMDDTDLITKVTERDVCCIAALLNRLESFASGKESEVLDFSDLKRDKGFAKKAARRILENAQMYALYKAVYSLREQDVDKNVQEAAKDAPSNFFVDTKIQNKVCRIGQSKLFSCNFPSYSKLAEKIRKNWVEKAKSVLKEKPEVGFHLQMISTIPSADEVHAGQIGPYAHKDELWFWVEGEKGLAHLKSFLTSFSPVLEAFKGSLSIETPKSFGSIFKAAFPCTPLKEDESLECALLKFEPGQLNSRKAMITPYLP